MKFFLTLIVVVLVFVTAWLILPRTQCHNESDWAVSWFRSQTNAYITSLEAMKEKIGQMNSDSLSVIAARDALIRCRLQYKRISYFLEYYFPEQALVCNGPPVPEIENGLLEYRDPSGMQMMEDYLFADNPTASKDALTTQVELVERSLNNILPFLDNFHSSRNDVLRALGLELVRTYALYLTGYDAPKLKSGITESAVTLQAMDSTLSPFMQDDDSLMIYLRSAQKFLSAGNSFDHFDRLTFITDYAIPLQRKLNALVERAPVMAPDQSAFSPASAGIFAPNALDKRYFSHGQTADSPLVALGRMLFFETKLSGNRQRSCATCHSPVQYFSDRLKRNKTQEGSGDLPRNTPGLLYAVYQSNQFWDGRVNSLEEQALAVLNDTLEMKGTGMNVAERLASDSTYRLKFSHAYKTNSPITENQVATALAAFIRTLTPFDSPFDEYLSGKRQSLNAAQKRGFNLFMGKAQCGSCHFIPLFNGLLPPQYRTTEFEVLGTPQNDQFTRVKADSDTGRASAFAGNGLGAFKTPTVRNAAMTAPYMHNGGFGTLESVIDFYDKGGGRGLGLPVENQTLADTPLNLTQQEKTDIKLFIESLTDKCSHICRFQNNGH